MIQKGIVEEYSKSLDMYKNGKEGVKTAITQALYNIHK